MNPFRWLPRLTRLLSLLMLAGVLPLSGCGDPDTGTIKAPSRDSMQPGASGDSGPATGKKLSPKAEPKTIMPGGKKLPG